MKAFERMVTGLGFFLIFALDPINGWGQFSSEGEDLQNRRDAFQERRQQRQEENQQRRKEMQQQRQEGREDFRERRDERRDNFQDRKDARQENRQDRLVARVAIGVVALGVTCVSQAQEGEASQTRIYNTAKQKLLEGKQIFGGTVSSSDVGSYCAMANAGFDFLWIEMQHSPLTFQPSRS